MFPVLLPDLIYEKLGGGRRATNFYKVTYEYFMNPLKEWKIDSNIMASLKYSWKQLNLIVYYCMRNVLASVLGWLT